MTLRSSLDYAVGGLLLIRTPYRAGVEYGRDFTITFVQNVRQKSRKRLHTFRYTDHIKDAWEPDVVYRANL